MSPRRIGKEPSKGLVGSKEDLVRRFPKDAKQEEYENNKRSRSLGTSVSILEEDSKRSRVLTITVNRF
jgi:hypothetical protein